MELTILAKKASLWILDWVLNTSLEFQGYNTANNLFRLYTDLVTLTITFTDTRKTTFFEC